MRKITTSPVVLTLRLFGADSTIRNMVVKTGVAPFLAAPRWDLAAHHSNNGRETIVCLKERNPESTNFLYQMPVVASPQITSSEYNLLAAQARKCIQFKSMEALSLLQHTITTATMLKRLDIGVVDLNECQQEHLELCRESLEEVVTYKYKNAYAVDVLTEAMCNMGYQGLLSGVVVKPCVIDLKNPQGEKGLAVINLNPNRKIDWLPSGLEMRKDVDSSDAIHFVDPNAQIHRILHTSTADMPRYGIAAIVTPHKLQELAEKLLSMSARPKTLIASGQHRANASASALVERVAALPPAINANRGARKLHTFSN